MTNLLLYSNENEPITKVLLKNKSKLKIVCFDLQHFIKSTNVFDEISQFKTKIQWEIPGLGIVTNSKNTKVINRVFDFPIEWFSCFHKDDLNYAKNELWAYFTFSLNAFKSITEKPDVGGLAGGCYSLTAQWKLITDRFAKDLKTPSFFIGPNSLLPKELSSDIIFSEPYNFYFWKPGNCDDKLKDSALAIQKPQGEPVLVFRVGEECSFYSKDNKCIAEDIKNRLNPISKKVHKSFKFFASEALYFVDNQQITFGMINNVPAAASQANDFEGKIVKEVKRFIKG